MHLLNCFYVASIPSSYWCYFFRTRSLSLLLHVIFARHRPDRLYAPRIKSIDIETRTARLRNTHKHVERIVGFFADCATVWLYFSSSYQLCIGVVCLFFYSIFTTSFTIIAFTRLRVFSVRVCPLLFPSFLTFFPYYCLLVLFVSSVCYVEACYFVSVSRVSFSLTYRFFCGFFFVLNSLSNCMMTVETKKTGKVT